MDTITWDDFSKVELRAGKIIKAELFPEAKKPAFKLLVDFGNEIGIKKSSAQITDHYTPEKLIGKMVVAVVNFPVKQIGPMKSECLVTGFYSEEGGVILCVPDKDIEPGKKLL
jgi:tRNA-binding protein